MARNLLSLGKQTMRQQKAGARILEGLETELRETTEYERRLEKSIMDGSYNFFCLPAATGRIQVQPDPALQSFASSSSSS